MHDIRKLTNKNEIFKFLKLTKLLKFSPILDIVIRDIKNLKEADVVITCSVCIYLMSTESRMSIVLTFSFVRTVIPFSFSMLLYEIQSCSRVSETASCM